LELKWYYIEKKNPSKINERMWQIILMSKVQITGRSQ